jgi:hypothetical protein
LLEAGDWLVVALARALPECDVDRRIVDECREELLRFLLDAEGRGQAFSLLNDYSPESAA